MSNRITGYDQYRGTVHFYLEHKPLNHASFVITRKGDMTEQFCGVAQYLPKIFARILPENQHNTDFEINIQQAAQNGKPTVAVRRFGPDPRTPVPALTPEQLATLKAYMDEIVARDLVIDENALLAWSQDVQNCYRTANGEYSEMADWYVHEKLVPDRIKETKGDDVGIGFEGFIPDGSGGTMIGLTLGNQCKACPTSYMNTLIISNDKIADFMLRQDVPEETKPRPDNFQGIIVLPNEDGSPSMTFRRQPARLIEEAKPSGP